MVELTLVIRVVIAMLLGCVLGWQRQQRGKWAGLRTYALVSGGSALFTVISLTAFGGDPARIASNIVTGIGFLGAGTILHKQDRVEGLTTAAGLWMVAAVGMTVALELYILAATVSLLSLLIFSINGRKIGLKMNDGKSEDD
ncbi:MAG: putative Mg2+ transporter-C (MgtC) family protein [Parcubacteria group bacterium Gr01-1014_13]|nr:MAG: putative Mg2+ transporter-C (MgtC) family protein [Parcubacteria group bacterium Gr01-1014_13]